MHILASPHGLAASVCLSLLKFLHVRPRLNRVCLRMCVPFGSFPLTFPVQRVWGEEEEEEDGTGRRGRGRGAELSPCTFPIALREQIAEGWPGQNGLCNFANVPESLKSLLLPSLQTLPARRAAAPLPIAFQSAGKEQRRVPRPSSRLDWRRVCSPTLALLAGDFETRAPLPSWWKSSPFLT